MKNIPTASALCLTLVSIVQAATNVHTWAESFGVGSNTADFFYGSGFDFSVGIAKLSDASMVVAGQLDLPELQSFHTGDGAGAAMVRYGADGGILWQKQLRIDGTSGLSRAQNVFTHNDDILLTGIKNPFAGGIYPFVAKFDSSGNVLWEVSPTQNGVDSNNQFRPILAGTQFVFSSLTADGGIIACTHSYTNGNGHFNPALIKISGTGGVEFISAFEQGVVQYMDSSAVCQLHNLGGYALAVDYPGTPNSGPGIGILIVGNAGRLQQQFVIPNDTLYWTEHAVSIIPTFNNDIVVLSSRAGNVDNGIILRRIHLIAASPSNSMPTASIVFAKYFPDTGMAPSTLAQTSDGRFIVGGHRYNGGTSGEDVAFMKFDPSGNILSFRTIGGPRREGGNADNGNYGGGAVVAMNDGGYGFTIATDSYKTGSQDKPDWWVGKTDSTCHIANYAGSMLNLGVSAIMPQNQNSVTIPLTAFSRYPVTNILGNPPNFVLKNLAAKTGANKPTVKVQALDSF